MRLKFIALIAVATLSLPAAVSAEIPTLQAMPSAVAMTLHSGTTHLSDHAVAYVPKSLKTPAPLILLLHGSNTDAEGFIDEFRSEADHRGAILLAVDPATHWTLKPDGQGGADFGPDTATIDKALQALFAKAPIDPARTAILGFSDGARYALSLGLANPSLFHGVVALSPGSAWLPPGIDKNQRIFVSHGMRDEVLPYKNTHDVIVPGLQAAGLQVKTHWLNAGHDIDRRVVAEALDYVLGQ